MNFEKLVNSRINKIADWIIRLVVINVLMIFSSLLVVTVYPAISAGYNMFNDYINDRETRLFKDYFKYFRENLGRKIVVSIIMIIVFTVAIQNVIYYNQVASETADLFHKAGYFVTLSLMAIFYATSIYTVVVTRVNPRMKFTSLFKLSFFLAGKNFLRTALLVLVNSLPVLFILIPQLIPLFAIMGISVSVALHAAVSNSVVDYLEDLGENNG